MSLALNNWDFFPILSYKHMLWILIRSASLSIYNIGFYGEIGKIVPESLFCYLQCYGICYIITWLTFIMYKHTCDSTVYDVKNKWAVSLGICRQRRPRSAGTSTQSDQGLPRALTEPFDTTGCMNGEQSLDETLRMCRMITICIFCTCSKALFPLTLPIWMSQWGWWFEWNTSPICKHLHEGNMLCLITYHLSLFKYI